ncbi:UNVERIFIED_CONTAM: hypothetical protein RMT77_011682 [Armadillidium vulgare]
MLLNRIAYAIGIFLIFQFAFSNGKDNDTRITEVRRMFSIGKNIAIAKDEADEISNYVVSPIILGILLELFSYGTDGYTKSEILNIFTYSEGIILDSDNEKLKLIIDSYKDVEGGSNLCVKTRLFLDKKIPYLFSFESHSKFYFRTEIEKVDFKSSPNAVKDKINSWANKSTLGKISEIYSKPLSPDTKLIAAGTLSFNGIFEFPFLPALTKKGTFNTGKKNITIPMMKGIMFVPYHKDQKLGYEIISIPYKGNRFVLLIVKPTAIGDKDNKKKLYTSLSKKGFQPVLDKMNNQIVEVTLPKMKIDIADNENITKNLKSLEINQIFNESADFSRFTSKSGVFVNKILQKFLIEISEEGSVGVKATAKGFMPPTNATFSFDRPSFLVLRDQKYGLDLFGARVTNPQPLK